MKENEKDKADRLSSDKEILYNYLGYFALIPIVVISLVNYFAIHTITQSFSHIPWAVAVYQIVTWSIIAFVFMLDIRKYILKK